MLIAGLLSSQRVLLSRGDSSTFLVPRSKTTSKSFLLEGYGLIGVAVSSKDGQLWLRAVLQR